MVCGELAREAFDAIVELLADGRFRPQVMTRIGEGISLEEAVEEFLKETWPSEDRFDDWKEYAILDLTANPNLVSDAVLAAVVDKPNEQSKRSPDDRSVDGS